MSKGLTAAIAVGLLVLCLAMTIGDSGEEKGVSLPEIADKRTLRLTTRGRKTGKLHAVSVWFVYEGGRLYLQAGRGGQQDWYKNLRKNPAVTLEIGNLVLRGTARPVEDQEGIARIHALFLKKYLTARIANFLGFGFGTGKPVEVTVESGEEFRKEPKTE